MRRSRAVLPIALAGLLAAAAPARQRARTVDEILATVNGVAVTRRDVDRVVEEARRAGRPIARGEALRGIIVQRLLERRAADEGVSVPDDVLEKAIKRRVQAFGGAEAYDRFLVEHRSTRAADRLEVRRRLLADLYVDRALGRVAGAPPLRPDLVRACAVTPRALREEYAAHADELVVPERFVLERVLVPGAAEDEALGREVRAWLEAARGGRSLFEVLPPDRRGLLARLEADAQEVAQMVEEARRFVENAAAGDTSPPIQVGDALVLLRLVERRPAHRLTFAEAQPLLVRWLRAKRDLEARRLLEEELLREAILWPPDLFDRSEFPPGPGEAVASPKPPP